MGETDKFGSPREPGPDRRDNVTSAGLDPDTWERLEQYRVNNRLSRSEATRRIVREYLEYRQRAAIRLIGTLAGIAFVVSMLFVGERAGAVVGGSYIIVTLLWASAPTFKHWLQHLAGER